MHDLRIGDSVIATFGKGRHKRRVKAVVITVRADGRVEVEMINSNVWWRPVLERAQVERLNK